MNRMNHSIKVAVLPAMIVLWFCLSTYADILHVPGDYNTVEEAIPYASGGDTILIAEGTFIGFHYFGHSETPRNITIMGSGYIKILRAF